MPQIYISRPIDAKCPIPWSRFMPEDFLPSLHEAFQRFSLHPREPSDIGHTWVGVEASNFPRIDFYHEPTREGVVRALDAYAAIGARVGQWAASSYGVRFAAARSERWDFDHRVSLGWRRGKLAEPSLCWFNFGRQRWDHTDAPAQATFWNEWAQRYQMPVTFRVIDGVLAVEVEQTEAIVQVGQRMTSLASVQKMESGFGCPTDIPPFPAWMEAFLDILDSRSRELRVVSTELWHYELPPGMSRDGAMQRLLAEALPCLSGTIWNEWTFDGFLTSLRGLETLQAYSGPDDQQRIELGRMFFKKGGEANLFLLVEKAGVRLAIASLKRVDDPIFDQLESDSGFIFHRSPARKRRAPTTYTLYEAQYLAPAEVTDDPGPELPLDLRKWTRQFHKERKQAARR